VIWQTKKKFKNFIDLHVNGQKIRLSWCVCVCVCMQKDYIIIIIITINICAPRLGENLSKVKKRMDCVGKRLRKSIASRPFG